MEGATCVAIEGDLPLWTQQKLQKIGLSLWVDRKARSTAMPEVLVATTEARNNPSWFFKRCRDNGVRMCTEDWLHECALSTSKGKRHPSYRAGKWCFNPWDATDEVSGTEDEDMEDVYEVDGIGSSYRSFEMTFNHRTWGAIALTSSDKIVAIRADNKKMWRLIMLDGMDHAFAKSSMRRKNFPIISPAHLRDLPDEMSEIYAVAISNDESLLLCAWKDNGDSFDRKNALPFKLVHRITVQDRYNAFEATLWFSALNNKAKHGSSCTSRFKGGSKAFRAVMERIR